MKEKYVTHKLHGGRCIINTTSTHRFLGFVYMTLRGLTGSTGHPQAHLQDMCLVSGTSTICLTVIYTRVD